jgi:hypothetical protein
LAPSGAVVKGTENVVFVMPPGVARPREPRISRTLCR